MCFYMAWITNVDEIVFGANIKDAINFGSNEINISDKELNKKGGDKIKLTDGFLREECLGLFE